MFIHLRFYKSGSLPLNLPTVQAIPDGRSVVRPLTVTMQTFPNINNTLESSVSAMPASKVDGLNVNKKKGNMISHGSTKSLTDSMRKEFAHGCASAMAIPFTV